MEEILWRLESGDAEARNELFDLLYDDLHSRAQRTMRSQGPGHTLQPTALVAEVFLKLSGSWKRSPERSPNDRSHFLAVASRAMRQVIVDHAKSKGRLKRQPLGGQVALEHVFADSDVAHEDVEHLDAALQELATFDATMALGVELRVFGGSTVTEAAQVVGLTKRTFERKWAATIEWLQNRMSQ